MRYTLIPVLVGTLILLLSVLPTLAQPRDQWARNLPPGESVRDIYQTESGEYAVCGESQQNGDFDGWWALINPADGDRILSQSYRLGDDAEHFMSLIEVDGGGFLLAGYTTEGSHDFYAVRIEPDGEPIWQQIYDRGGQYDYCYAVIELKDGDFLLAGSSGSAGRLLRIRGDGEVVWDKIYDHVAATEVFYSMREIEDGVLLAGKQHPDGWLLWVDQEGEPTEERTFQGEVPGQEVEGTLTFFSLIPCREGGFLAAGKLYFNIDLSYGWFTRVTANGDLLWDTFAESDRIGDRHQFVLYGVTETQGAGFTAVGGINRGHPSNSGAIIHSISQDGDFGWQRRIPASGDLPVAISLSTALTLPDRSLLTGGLGMAPDTADQNQTGAFLIKYDPEVSPPQFVLTEPPPPEVDILRNDTVRFRVRAVDLQGDQIDYKWIFRGEIVSRILSYNFHSPDIGEYELSCVVSDSEPGDSVNWRIRTREVLIENFFPDTTSLHLRRGDRVDFSIEVGTADDSQPGYQWLLTNVGQETDTVISRTARSPFSFVESGDYRISATAFRAGDADAQEWSVSVRGIIWSIYPASEYIAVINDSLIHFEVVPSNPEDASLTYEWRVDGELARENVSWLDWRFQLEMDQYSHLSVIVNDSTGCDTVEWIAGLTMTEAGDNRDSYPTRVGLFTVSPNPFNSTLTIRYAVGLETDATRLTIHDISGREVFSFGTTPNNSGKITPPTPPAIAGGDSQTLVWDATTFPAGIYFARLETNGTAQVSKLVLIR